MQTTPNPVAGVSTAAPGTAPQVQTRLGIDAGTIPVDQTRVDEIRKAVQSGTYPLVPAKIGDAMVAAGLLLRKTS
jgi:negative regulator of flagellin synthesis FlgM